LNNWMTKEHKKCTLMFEFQLVASLQSLKVFFHFPDFTGAYGTSLIAPLILKLDKSL